jgi:hypothetical protein
MTLTEYKSCEESGLGHDIRYVNYMVEPGPGTWSLLTVGYKNPSTFVIPDVSIYISQQHNNNLNLIPVFKPTRHSCLH